MGKQLQTEVMIKLFKDNIVVGYEKKYLHPVKKTIISEFSGYYDILDSNIQYDSFEVGKKIKDTWRFIRKGLNE